MPTDVTPLRGPKGVWAVEDADVTKLVIDTRYRDTTYLSIPGTSGPYGSAGSWWIVRKSYGTDSDTNKKQVVPANLDDVLLLLVKGDIFTDLQQLG